MPHSIVGNAVPIAGRWLKEAGAASSRKTWDEARKVFAPLKKKGKPYGQSGHTFGDAPTFTYHDAVGVRRGRDRQDRQEGHHQ